MTDWQSGIDWSQPYWSDYLPFVDRLCGTDFPTCDQFNELLPPGVKSHGGQAVRFVASTSLEDAPYEQRIFTTGRVSTRPRDWHDLFNALVWARFPRIKIAMNALHYSVSEGCAAPTRGPLRDALTLFDECGVIVYSSHPEPLEALARRNWEKLFRTNDPKWGRDLQIAVVGHAMLEKFLTPYKSMTAKALLVQLDRDILDGPREGQLAYLDGQLATRMLADGVLDRPARLAPLPLAGVPGWWADKQNEEFYSDRNVFRVPPPALAPTPVIKLGVA